MATRDEIEEARLEAQLAILNTIPRAAGTGTAAAAAVRDMAEAYALLEPEGGVIDGGAP